MDTLDSFLMDEFQDINRDIGEIEKHLSDVQLVFEKHFSGENAWPYEVRKVPGAAQEKKLSESTTAMILGSLLRLQGKFTTADRRAHAGSACITQDAGARHLTPGLASNIETASEQLRKKIVQPNGTLKLESQSFGENDVFTLAWVARVSQADWPSGQQEKWKTVGDLCFSTANAKFDDWRDKAFSKPSCLLNPTNSSATQHSFPALRLIQSIREIRGDDFGALAECSEYFEHGLHQHLSFSAIPDSRFDPAELMFCLEGMLQCQRNTVDRGLFDRVIAVLTAVQSENAFWRPVKPYLATSQGHVLFPVSIEIANSLLRACSVFDKNQLHDTYASKCIPLLRRYWQWLRARTTRFRMDSDDRDLVGWHSEHVNEPTLIHLWETSQVIEFLLSLRDALAAHVGRITLIRSRIDFKSMPKDALDVKDEPAKYLGENLRIHERIRADFVVPRTEGTGDPQYTMLLYGPPGTGKTTIAKKLASELRMRLLTITVSDFLSAGPTQVDARAKAIFQVLECQPPCVVLFDEIDHFLLDRDSQRYNEQETGFQFMTPGMLTKLSDLRAKNCVIFIVATNYADRIDAAIKRPGRIDRQFLVLPPDAHLRLSILRTKLVGSDETEIGKGIFGSSLTKDVLDRLVGASVFLGRKEIEIAVSIAIGSTTKSVAALEARLEKAARSSSLESYASRFLPDVSGRDPDLRKTPIGEFLCLLAIREEISKPLSPREGQIVKRVAKLMAQSATSVNESLVSDYAPELEEPVLKRIASSLNSQLSAK